MSTHEQRAHFPLGPSASSRWRKCVPSIARSAALPGPPASKAALAGTYRHEWAEYCLRNGDWDASVYVGCVHPVHGGEELSREAADHVNSYLELVAKILEPDDEMLIEQRLSLVGYFNGLDVGDGTGDCLIYKPKRRHLHVLDAKFGFLEVAVEGNTQGLQYGLGGFELYRERGIDKITIWICQPRSSSERWKKWTIDAADLFDEGLELKAAYARTLLPDQPYVVGTHCTFCKVGMAGLCEARRSYATEKAAAGFEALNAASYGLTARAMSAPSSEVLGAMIKEAEPIRGYLKALDELAESEARQGRIPAGRKWVATPGRRAWGGDDAAIAVAIEARMPEVDVWETALKSPPTLERQIGKAELAKLADLITKTPGGFSLVSGEDKRPAVQYSKAADGFEAA